MVSRAALLVALLAAAPPAASQITSREIGLPIDENPALTFSFFGPRNQVARRAFACDERPIRVEGESLDIALTGCDRTKPRAVDGTRPERDPAIDKGANDKLLSIG